jgi:hypothetical protein
MTKLNEGSNKSTKVSKSSKRTTYVYIFLVVSILFYLTFITMREFSRSLFVANKERLNLVFYGNESTFYSLSSKDPLDYAISFYPDLKVQIPGGYDFYRIGALGKLVSLENKPEIFRKTFSYATTTFIDIYFYSPKPDIYYGKNKVDEVKLPTVQTILFSPSNANVFDRLYLVSLFSNKRAQQIKTLGNAFEEVKENDIFYITDDFLKKYQGFFYRSVYREEKRNVQILYYGKYRAADAISKIMEGDGIRVSDISETDKQIKQCVVKENVTSFSQTARDISTFFGCKLERGETDVYDIQVELGEKEDEWEMK